MSVVTYHLRPWRTHTFVLKACMVEQSRAWHAIIALGKHARFEYVGRGMPSSHLDNIHRVKRRRVWLPIIVLGQHTRSDNLRHCILSSPLDCTQGQTMLGIEMLSSPFVRTHARMLSGIKCHSCPLASRHYRTMSTWHGIKAFGKHTQMEDGCGMPS